MTADSVCSLCGWTWTGIDFGYAGVSAIPESASGELRALESGTLSNQGRIDIVEHAELGTQTSNGLAENGSSSA